MLRVLSKCEGGTNTFYELILFTPRFVSFLLVFLNNRIPFKSLLHHASKERGDRVFRPIAAGTIMENPDWVSVLAAGVA